MASRFLGPLSHLPTHLHAMTRMRTMVEIWMRSIWKELAVKQTSKIQKRKRKKNKMKTKHHQRQSKETEKMP